MAKVVNFLTRVKHIFFGNARMVLVLLVMLIFLGMLTWTGPEMPRKMRMAAAASQMENTATVNIQNYMTETPGPTPIPIEWQTNYSQTNGVAVGGVILVLIVIGGAIAVLSKKRPEDE